RPNVALPSLSPGRRQAAMPLSFPKFSGLRLSSHTPPHLLAHATSHESYSPSLAQWLIKLRHAKIRSRHSSFPSPIPSLDRRTSNENDNGGRLLRNRFCVEHSDEVEFENREENKVGDDDGNEQGTTTAAPGGMVAERVDEQQSNNRKTICAHNQRQVQVIQHVPIKKKDAFNSSLEIVQDKPLAAVYSLIAAPKQLKREIKRKT
ncbi:unnamed protein product, partial [Linum tenue]